MKRVAECVLITILVSGCGTFNPHLRGEDKEVGEKKIKNEQENTKNPSPLPLVLAIRYADSAKKNYHDALGNQSRLNSWLGVGLIPLAAAATGVGIVGGPAVAITTLGLTGAAGYGIGTWLTSKPSQRAWVAGFNATSCAIDVLIPLLPIEKKLDEFENEIKGIAINIRLVTSNISALDEARDNAVKSANLAAVVKEAEAVRAEAVALIASGRLAETKARELYVDAYTAGQRLKEAVDRISGQVSLSLVENGRDLQALSSIIGGLGQLYNQFIPTPATDSKGDNKTPKSSTIDETNDPETQFRRAINNLRNANGDLASSIGTVASKVNIVVGQNKLVETLKACGVAAEKIVVPMIIDPPGTINIDGCTATTSARVIKGGVSPYAVALPATAAAANITVRQTATFGPAFVVETTTTTQPIKTTIQITDGSSNNAFIDVIVTEGKCGTDKKPTTPENPIGKDKS
jgi:hypothetical protein